MRPSHVGSRGDARTGCGVDGTDQGHDGKHSELRNVWPFASSLVAKHATTASADFCSPALSYLRRSAFRASSTHGYACRSPQIRTWTFTAQARHLLRILSGTVSQTSSVGSPQNVRCLYGVSVRSLAALAGNVSDGDHSGRSLRFTSRRLPSHGRSLFRSCPRLVLHSQRNIWHTASSMSPVFVQGTGRPHDRLHPTSPRPCWAYR